MGSAGVKKSFLPWEVNEVNRFKGILIRVSCALQGSLERASHSKLKSKSLGDFAKLETEEYMSGAWAHVAPVEVGGQLCCT